MSEQTGSLYAKFRPSTGIPPVILAAVLALVFFIVGIYIVLLVGSPVLIPLPIVFLVIGVQQAKIEHENWRSFVGEIKADEEAVHVEIGNIKKTFPYSEAKGFSYYTTGVFNQGVYKGERFDIKIWSENELSGNADVRLSANFIEEQELKAVSELVAALIGKFNEQFRRQVDSGGKLSGKDFSFASDGLEYGSERIACGDISAVLEEDGDLRIWRKDEQLPAVCLPIKEANVVVLTQLLEEMLAGRGDSESVAVEGQGRLLFERVTDKNFIILLGTIALFFTFYLLKSVYWALTDSTGYFVLTFLCSIPCGILLPIVYHLYIYRLSFYEGGVEKVTIWGKTTIDFVDVEIMTFSLTRLFTYASIELQLLDVGASYKANEIKIRFEAPGEKKPWCIEYTAESKSTDRAIERLKDKATFIIGLKHYDKVKKGGKIPWGDGQMLSDQALVFVERFTNKPVSQISYSRIDRLEIKDGFCKVYIKEKKESAVDISCGDKNFHPGLFVISQFLEELKEEEG